MLKKKKQWPYEKEEPFAALVERDMGDHQLKRVNSRLNTASEMNKALMLNVAKKDFAQCMDSDQKGC